MANSHGKLDSVVNDLIAKSANHTAKFAQVKKTIERIPLTFTPQQLATLIDDEGPILITTSQACEIKNMLQTKVSTFSYIFHHVLCSRVLDFWNLDSYGGIGDCYYGVSVGGYYPSSNTPEGIYARIRKVAKDFGERTLYDNAINKFIASTQPPPQQTTTTTTTSPSIECTICVTTAREVMFEPCNHVVCCNACSEKVTQCPVCRVELTKKTRVYL